MNHRFTGRYSTRAVAPGVFGMLLVLCLNLAAVPCAMALGIDDQTCPHSPAAEHGAMDEHHGHGMEHANQLAEQSHPDCLSAASCCDLAVASVDSRSAQVKVKDGFDDEPAAVAAIASTLQPVARYAIAAAADPPDPPGTAVPRHVLFCVYLD